MANHYDIPDWAVKPPVGHHLDVLKEERLVQKLMVDEKRCYLFGRNEEMCDFKIDHQSCSRVHAAFVYHKQLNKCFLVDLGSTHGTFIGKMKCEAHKPTQLPVNSNFHFGHSTRIYVLRARPQVPDYSIVEDIEMDVVKNEPTDEEMEMAIDNMTEFNTAQNRNICQIGITDIAEATKAKKKICVTFNEDEEVINPEDVDPTVGRFRNLVHTTVIPKKRARFVEEAPVAERRMNPVHPSRYPVTPPLSQMYYEMPGLYSGLGPTEMSAGRSSLASAIETLRIPLPNPAPDVEAPVDNVQPYVPEICKMSFPASKKKYAKEAWPGKKPSNSGMLL